MGRWMVERGGKGIDRHSSGGNRRAAGGPADRLGDIDRGYQGIFRRRQGPNVCSVATVSCSLQAANGRVRPATQSERQQKIFGK